MFFKYYGFVIVAALSTASCSMIGDIPFASDVEEKEEYKAYTGEPVDKYTENEHKRLINQYIDEWETLKPSINRVLALEDELTYAIQALEDSNFLENNVVASELPELPPAFLANNTNQSTVVNTNNIKVDSTALTFTTKDTYGTSMDAKFTSVKQNTKIKVGAAKPLGDISENANETDKFSRGNSTISYSASQPCGHKDYVADGKTFAVHLASYSKKGNAVAGQQSFLSKYNNELCEKMAVLKSVDVKGTNYYSLRFGPYFSTQEAQSICSRFKKQKDYCSVSRFDGERIN
jgi:hypothetical protein